MNIIQPKNLVLVLLLSFFGSSLSAQVLAKVGDMSVDAKEFMWVFNKNNVKTKKAGLAELQDYLQLYINFKLKVAEAKALGFDLDTNYIQEIAGYEKALNQQNQASIGSQEYQYVLNEYREGVLMFNLSEQKVWNKAQENEAKILDFYKTHRDKYQGRSFEDVRGQVISDLQQALEVEWVDQLRLKYPVKINEKELKKLAQH